MVCFNKLYCKLNPIICKAPKLYDHELNTLVTSFFFIKLTFIGFKLRPYLYYNKYKVFYKQFLLALKNESYN